MIDFFAPKPDIPVLLSFLLCVVIISPLSFVFVMFGCLICEYTEYCLEKIRGIIRCGSVKCNT